MERIDDPSLHQEQSDLFNGSGFIPAQCTSRSEQGFHIVFFPHPDLCLFLVRFYYIMVFWLSIIQKMEKRVTRADCFFDAGTAEVQVRSFIAANNENEMIMDGRCLHDASVYRAGTIP